MFLNTVNLSNHLRYALTAVVALICCNSAVAEHYSPKADDKAIVLSGNTRFTVLTPEMIRIEHSAKGAFEDRATFAVVNRALDVPKYKSSEDSEFLYITTDKLNLRYRKGTNPLTSPASPDNLSISFIQNGEKATWYPGKPDPLNLKGTCRTLDGSNGDNKRSELENGIISRSGWTVIDDSWSTKRADGSRSFAFEADSTMGFDWWAERNDPDALDLYFMGYGKDYKKALYDFTLICGKIPLPPAYIFGYWYSKYASYSADDYRHIMSDLESNNIPCDVMILDMDWHWNGNKKDSDGRGGWTGWSWNTKLIPDPKGLLNDIHNRNFKIALNLHPADGVCERESPQYYSAMNRSLNGKYLKGDTIPWVLDNTDFAKPFFDNIIRDHESEGVDFWWIDWQQHLTSRYTKGLGETFWCNHVFFNDMVKNRPERRPVIFHRWGGLGSHRYQIGFSGDALINFPTLAFQPYFTATASNVGYGYWGHDLGGHVWTGVKNANNPELVLRWIQFGVFTPMFRTHATKETRIERQIWKFPNFPDMLDAVNLRYSLFPYIYTMAREAYDTGISICRPLYYDFPDSEEAYKYENEYMFGNDILVAPIVEEGVDGISTKTIWFPEGKWWSMATNELIEGPCVKEFKFNIKQIPYFFRQGSMIPFNPAGVKSVTERPGNMVIHTVARGNGAGRLYEDGGDNADYASNYAFTEMTCKSDGKKDTFVILPRKITTTGNAPELMSKRGYTLNVHGCDVPSSVKINGKKISNADYQYDKTASNLIVTIPTTDCNKTIKVEVKH